MAVHPNSLENLKKGNRFTKETAKINGAKGGHAAAPVLAARKSLRADLEALLASHPNDPKTGRQSEQSLQEAITLALVKKALKGDTKAYELIRDTIGEKPAEKIMLTEIDPQTVEEVEKMVKGCDA